MDVKAKPDLVNVKRASDRRSGGPRQVSFDYIKGSQFRTVHPDGAIGGASPPDRVQIAFFCERQAIPQRVTYQLNEDGTLGSTIETVGRDAVVREIDIVVSLSRETAQGLINFLTQALTAENPSAKTQTPSRVSKPPRKKTK